MLALKIAVTAIIVMGVSFLIDKGSDNLEETPLRDALDTCSSVMKLLSVVVIVIDGLVTLWLL
jgi:hypothetical protein